MVGEYGRARVTRAHPVEALQCNGTIHGRTGIIGSMEESFNPFVAEHLQYYVYLLADPRTGAIFYIGKGTGNRVFAHAQDALDSTQASDKLERIREIHASGLRVSYELLRFGLNEKAAYEVEAAAIQLLRLDELLNEVAGHHAGTRGRMSVSDAISLFDAPPAPTIADPAVLIRIPKLWYPNMAPEELQEATAGWWKIGVRREKAQYAFSVNRGVIREIYKIDSWRARKAGDRDFHHDKPGKPRWGFDGQIAREMAHYRNTSVRHLFQPGEASPVKYVNC